MKKNLLILLFLLPVLGWTQSTNVSTLFHNRIKKADIYFNHYAYQNALHLYLHALDKDPKNTYVMEQIAECYFKLHDPIEAEKWFRIIIEAPVVEKNTKFEFAEVLCINGNYEEAKQWYAEAIKDNPDNQMAKDKLHFLNNIGYYEADSLEFLISPVEFNTNHAEYGAHMFRDGIVFASSRDLSWFIKHRPFDAAEQDESLLNLFYVKGKSIGEFGQAQLLHNEKMKAILHEGPMAFYDGDKKAAFTRTNLRGVKLDYDENKKAHLQIYFADISPERELVNLKEFAHNSDDYSIGHPSVTPDGKTMYFSSTAPGGMGGSDIYYSNNINGNWTVPVNLGSNVNTQGDESFPFIANDSTLFFSSNGHGSLGGLDIMVSYRRNGEFSKPENFGAPLNSRFDDFSFQADAQLRSGFISSNRPGGKGLDDIYYFLVTNFFVKGHTVVNNERIPGVKISISDAENGNLVNTVTSGKDGFFDITLPFDKKFYLVGERDGFEPSEKILINTFGRGLNIDSLNFAMERINLFAKGKIYSKETQDVIRGVTLTALNVTDNKQVQIQFDDAGGAYSFAMLTNKKYRLEFSKPGYISEVLEINTTGLKNKSLLNDVVLEEQFEKNLVINFLYNSAELSAASLTSLKPFIDYMKRHPEYSLNIAAHADSRGTVEYNLKLSNRRASNTKDYFVSQGISEKRISWIGFGESLAINRCSEGVECPEEDHSLNRRAELKIQK